MTFFIEVLINGLMTGIMYSLVGLGFVLIFKASEVFNMAQGAMSLFAALVLYGFLEQYLHLPLWLSLLLTVGVMTIWAYVIVFVILKPLVNRPPLMLFMATFGVTYLMEGIGQSIYGTQAKGLNLGIPDNMYDVGGVFISSFDLVFAAVAAFLVAALVWFFQKTRSGRALRAVSDDHEAALSVGIPLLKAWSITWIVAGVVATVAGVAWGTRLGVQYSLSYIAYKALPVLIIGGLDSVPGVIIAGLIVGAGETLGEVFIGPYVGGGIQTFFPYLLALLVLYFKPYGLFGKEIIERV
jgi:branched-chain amino acid transport system permease protein